MLRGAGRLAGFFLLPIFPAPPSPALVQSSRPGLAEEPWRLAILSAVDQLTPTEAGYAAALARAEERRAAKDAERFHPGHSSRKAFEDAVAIYRAIAEKLERQAAR